MKIGLCLLHFISLRVRRERKMFAGYQICRPVAPKTHFSAAARTNQEFTAWATLANRSLPCMPNHSDPNGAHLRLRRVQHGTIGRHTADVRWLVGNDVLRYSQTLRKRSQLLFVGRGGGVLKVSDLLSLSFCFATLQSVAITLHICSVSAGPPIICSSCPFPLGSLLL